MKKTLRHSFIALAWLALLSTINSQLSTCLAQGTAFTYQGQLLEGGSPANGNYDLKLTLFNALTNGSSVAGPVTNTAVGVTNGLFTTTIDFGSAFDGNLYWLRIQVRTNGGNAFTTLSPRQQLSPAPYAEFATTAGNLSGTVAFAQLPAGLVTNSETSLTLAGNFSGNGTGLTNVNAATVNGLAAGSFWQLGGNSVSTGQYLGSANNKPVEIWANGQRAFRVEPDTTGSGAPNVIGGSPNNFVTAGGVIGGFIGGGGAVNYNGAAYSNNVAAYFGTIGGGLGNVVQAYANGGFIGGGYGNNVQNSSTEAVIGGGGNNIAGGTFSFVGGGLTNNAQGNFSTIGGGQNNTTLGKADVIVGGLTNYTSGLATTVGGGQFNSATANSAVVAGGFGNTASGPFTSIGGGYGNSANGEFGTIAGGNDNSATATSATVGGGYNNSAYGQNSVVAGGGGNSTGGLGGFASTVGGGWVNQANADYSTVAGGDYNNANGTNSSVGGGLNNNAIGVGATVPGGVGNEAAGVDSFAAGNGALAYFNGSFVWSDQTGTGTSDSAPNQFVARASGGFNFYTGTGYYGVSLAPGATSWTAISDRNAKKNFKPVDTQAVLAKLAAVPVQQWNYKWEKDTDVPNLGPMAQDFIAAFYPGRDDKGITTLQFDGVELAAIQGLNEKLEARSQKLEAENADLKARLEKLERIVETKQPH